MKKKCFGFILFIFFIIIKTNSQSYIWARNQVGVNFTYGNSTASDPAGNVYVTGHFFGQSIAFGNTTLTNSNTGFADFYIVKYDANGNVLWARSAGGANTESGTGIAIDQTGSIYVTGWFLSPDIKFDTIILINKAPYFFDMFLVKYDKNGNVTWAKSAGGPSDDKGMALAVDGMNNLTVTGSYKSNSIVFGSSTLVNSGPGYEEIFVIRYDPNGNILKASSYGGYGPDVASGITIDEKYNCYLTGSYLSPDLYFGPYSIGNNGLSDMFVTKIDSSGNVLWLTGAGSTGYDAGTSLTVDKGNNIYVSGYFTGPSIRFDTLTINNSGINTRDAYLTKLNDKGIVQWVQQGIGTADEYGIATIHDKDGNIYLGGYFNSSVLSFGNYSINNQGGDDIFLVKYNAAGMALSVKYAGCNANDNMSALSIDGSNNIYMTGSFLSQGLIFGKDTLSNSGKYEMFIVKLSEYNTGIDRDYFQAITIAPNPSDGNLTISIPGDFKEGSIKIYSLLGREISFEMDNSISVKQIQLTNLTEGIYFLTLTSKGREYTRKFIIR